MLLPKSRRIAHIGFVFGMSLMAGAFQATASNDVSADRSTQLLFSTLEDLASLHSMERDACFKMAGITTKDFATRVQTAVAAFNLSLEEQDAGGPVSGLAQQTAAQVSGLRKDWRTLSAALQQVSAGDFHAVPIRQVLALAPKVQSAVDSKRQALSDSIQTTTDARYVATLEQKVRVQMLVKKACYVLRGISAEDNLAALLNTIETFQKAHDAAVAAALSDEERQELSALQTNWTDFTVLLKDLKAQVKTQNVAKTQLSILGDAMTARLERLAVIVREEPSAAPNFNEFLSNIHSRDGS